MNSFTLDACPLWCVFALAVGFSLLGLELGYRFGRLRHTQTEDEKIAPIGAMVGAILGLLAFMLAFTFSLAASRYDSRRMTILEESNAIGTAYLRARILPQPEQTEVARLLREYVDVRVRSVEEGTIAEGVAQSEKLQEQMWMQATSAAQKNPASMMTALFIQSLNEVIDLHAKRVLIGTRSRVPFSIWLGLFALGMIGMAAMGYQAGLTATRRSPAMLLLATAFAGVLFLIVDLDRVQEGFLRIGQQSMIDLQKSMQDTRESS